MKTWTLILASAALVACGSNNDNNTMPTNNGGSDGGTTADMGPGGNNGSTDAGDNNGGGNNGGGDAGGNNGGDDGGDDMGGTGDDVGFTPGELPPVPQPYGVTYVGHLESVNLAYFRTDGDVLVEDGSIDVGGPVLDLALDPENDVLYASHPFDDQVSVWQLAQPTAGTPVAAPTELSRLTFERAVLAVEVDPYHDRLYVTEALPLPGNGSPQPDMTLHMYDVSDPANPTEVGTSVVPSTASWDIDPVRRLAFFVKESADELHGFDIAGDAAASLGAPIVLTGAAWYPEDNQFGFQARNLTLDPYTNRIYAARPMGTLSELIAIEYPAAIPGAGQTYAELGTMAELTRLDDAFDLSVDAMDRPNLLSAYQPVVDVELNMVLMSAEAWDGTRASAIMMGYQAEDITQLAPGCEDFEGFGCFYRPTFDGTPTGYDQTDGATCADTANKIVVGTTIDPNTVSNPGGIRAFKYSADGTMTPFLAEGDNTLNTDAYPVAVACH